MENDELAAYLDSLRRESDYRVDELIKESPFEVTQRVSLIDSAGNAKGPFIRKFIKRDTGIGAIYDQLYRYQLSGGRFEYIPRILECYMRDGELAVLMEFVNGITLQEYLYRCNPSLELAQRIFPILCDAVSELHERFDPPIIHRDLKPSNIMIDDRGEGFGLTIIDFGIARTMNDDAETDTTRFGTREFAPPEQFGFGQTTERSDVYALGILLYYCLTEEIPNARVRESGFPDKRITPAMREVITRAAAFDPGQRFASVRDLKSAFGLALGNSKSVPEAYAQRVVSAPAVRAAISPEMQELLLNPYEEGYDPASLAPGAQLAAAPAFGEPVKEGKGRARNWVIFGIAAFFTFLALAAAARAETSIEAFGYALWQPLLYWSIALLTADKQRLFQRIPTLDLGVAAWNLIAALGIFVAFVMVGVSAHG